MTNEEFVKVAKTIAASHTMYASGTFGQLFSESFIKQKQDQYPSWYSPYRVDAIRREMERTPLLEVTLPNFADDSLIENALS